MGSTAPRSSCASHTTCVSNVHQPFGPQAMLQLLPHSQQVAVEQAPRSRMFTNKGFCDTFTQGMGTHAVADDDINAGAAQAHSRHMEAAPAAENPTLAASRWAFYNECPDHCIKT